MKTLTTSRGGKWCPAGCVVTGWLRPEFENVMAPFNQAQRSRLKSWFAIHVHDPRPSASDLERLVNDTRLDVDQIKRWIYAHRIKSWDKYWCPICCGVHKKTPRDQAHQPHQAHPAHPGDSGHFGDSKIDGKVATQKRKPKRKRADSAPAPSILPQPPPQEELSVTECKGSTDGFIDVVADAIATMVTDQTESARPSKRPRLDKDAVAEVMKIAEADMAACVELLAASASAVASAHSVNRTAGSHSACPPPSANASAWSAAVWWCDCVACEAGRRWPFLASRGDAMLPLDALPLQHTGLSQDGSGHIPEPPTPA